jgi:glycosyltransferase involved in cell wall biosynthesis
MSPKQGPPGAPDRRILVRPRVAAPAHTLPTPLKILHAILSDGFYGSERYCIDLAIAQASLGHEVAVLITGGESDCAQQFRMAIAEARGDPAGAAAVRLIELPRFVPAWLQRPLAAALLMRLRPDIVHTHLNPAARRIGSMAQRLGMPHVLTLHLDYDPREHARIDGLVALSTKQREQIAQSFAGEVAIVWNWLPSRVEAALRRVDPSDVAQLRRSWQADDATLVFGSVGRLKPEKGMDTLIRAFRTAFVDRHSVRLVIVGEGEEREVLSRLAGADTRIVLAGTQGEVAPYYRAFDAFVSAARFEPFSLAIIEAMAAGCPLVCTEIHGTVEFVTDPRVLWAKPNDDHGLAVQLAAAAANETRVRFAFDMSPFTLTRAATEIEAFYRRVMAHRGGTAPRR